jgi:hypothetical protein
MKCDAGEIACAIDRLTDAMSGISTYDWWAQIWIPVILGVLTLGITTGVAIASVKVAHRSNALARQSLALSRQSLNMARKAEDEARNTARLKERVSLGNELVELLSALERESRGGHPLPSSSRLLGALQARLAFFDEPGSQQVLGDVLRALAGISPFTQEGNLEMSRMAQRTQHGISLWVREPDRYADWAWRRDNLSEEPVEPDFDA